jgi:TatA/E family protein of Tat protein translocase
VIGISFEQLILLLVLALILFGPEKLPEIAEKIGKWMVKLRQASSDFTQQYQQALNPPLPPPLAAPLPPEEFTCPHCSRTMEQRFTFCPHCGQRHEEEMPLGEHEEPPWYICPRCNRDLDSDFLFCPSCGHQRVEGMSHYRSPESAPPPKLITCPQCSRKLDADLLFCTGCGHTLEKMEEAPQVQKTPLKSGLSGEGPGA